MLVLNIHIIFSCIEAKNELLLKLEDDIIKKRIKYFNSFNQYLIFFRHLIMIILSLMLLILYLSGVLLY